MNENVPTSRIGRQPPQQPSIFFHLGAIVAKLGVLAFGIAVVLLFLAWIFVFPAVGFFWTIGWLE